MVIRKKKKNRKHIIDLTGPEGNAYYLLGLAESYCKQLGKDWDDVNKRMKASDYENLVKVFDEEFGSFVILER